LYEARIRAINGPAMLQPSGFKSGSLSKKSRRLMARGLPWIWCVLLSAFRYCSLQIQFGQAELVAMLKLQARNAVIPFCDVSLNIPL
jgi:hypothetical protein